MRSSRTHSEEIRTLKQLGRSLAQTRQNHLAWRALVNECQSTSSQLRLELVACNCHSVDQTSARSSLRPLVLRMIQFAAFTCVANLLNSVMAALSFQTDSEYQTRGVSTR